MKLSPINFASSRLSNIQAETKKDNIALSASNAVKFSNYPSSDNLKANFIPFKGSVESSNVSNPEDMLESAIKWSGREVDYEFRQNILPYVNKRTLPYLRFMLDSYRKHRGYYFSFESIVDRLELINKSEVPFPNVFEIRYKSSEFDEIASFLEALNEINLDYADIIATARNNDGFDRFSMDEASIILESINEGNKPNVKYLVNKKDSKGNPIFNSEDIVDYLKIITPQNSRHLKPLLEMYYTGSEKDYHYNARFSCEDEICAVLSAIKTDSDKVYELLNEKDSDGEPKYTPYQVAEILKEEC